MKEVNKDVLVDCAERLMFTMSDDQYEMLLEEFFTMIKQMKLIGQNEEVDKYSPMTFPFDVTTDFLREDVPLPPLEKEEALKNAKEVLDGQIKLPKVVG